jgi:branched-subunit amino acid transport protein
VGDATVVLIVLAVGTYAFKAAGPLVLGDRPLPSGLRHLVDLLPAALLAALTLVSTVGDGQTLTVDARLVGLGAAAIALWRRAPFVVVVIVASAATALTRAVLV